MRNAAALICIHLFTFCGSGPQATPGQLSAELLREDFSILRTTLEEAHPGLYWYSTKEQMDHYLDSTYRLIDQAMTGKDFFKLLLPVIANIRCVHSQLRPPADTVNRLIRFANILPFTVYCTPGKLYIREDFSGTGHAGAEILELNGTPVTQVMKTLLDKMPADGFNQTFKYALLNRGAFHEGYALFFDETDSFTISAIDTGKALSTEFMVKAKHPGEVIVGERPQPFETNLSFDSASSVPILTINTFEISSQRFSDSVAHYFAKLHSRGSRSLIIDIRGNGGGNNANISTLFSYLAEKPFLHLKRAETTAVPYTYAQYFSNRQNFTRNEGIAEAGGLYQVNHRYPGTTVRQPVTENLFTGKVVLLVSGYTTSAASEFAALVHETKRAMILGEEAGGCFYGATGGNYISLELPASKLRVRIPTIRIFTAVGNTTSQPSGRGTFPDQEVYPTIRDLLLHKDLPLQAAIKLCSSR